MTGKTKGNTQTSDKQYYMDSVMVVGPNTGKIYYHSTFEDMVKSRVDTVAVMAAVRKCAADLGSKPVS